MKTIFIAPVLLFFLGLQNLFAVQKSDHEKDLKENWLVNVDGTFVPFSERLSSPDVIYLQLEAKNSQGQILNISAVRIFDVFINNRLAGSGRRVVLNIDSLSRANASSNLLVAIHQKSSKYDDLSTVLISPVKRDALTDGLLVREGSFFRDFAVVAMLLLMGMAVLIVRLNPKLASDYFSVGGIFSFREIHDSQVYIRIGSSTNILFFAYCSMLLAYYFIVIFHFTTDVFPLANSFQGEHFMAVLWQWLKLSSYLMVFFFLKIVLVFGVSYLFGIPQIGGIHFFNWVRVVLVFFGLLTAILFIYFIWHGQSVEVHAGMLKLLGWILGAWIILIFLKLAGNASASMFHLFSYICATELVPFLFLIKVLYK